MPARFFAVFNITKRPLLAFFAIALMVFSIACRDGRPPNDVHSVADVPERIIGALAGTPSARLADELGTAREYGSGDELMFGLLSGYVECAVIESIVAGELVLRTQGVKVLSDTLVEYELRFAVPRENAELLDVVNSALLALEANGILRSIRDKYFSGRSYEYVPQTETGQLGGMLTLAVSSDSPPYSFIDSDGEYTGLDVEIARAVCDYLRVELRVVEEDVRELVTAVWFGRADFAAGWLPADIDEHVKVTEAYANTAYVIVVRR